MPKRQLTRKAFTLIEVMVAVMIVSVVIAALLQMQGNTNHKLLQLKKSIKDNQYNSFLISEANRYGFDSSNINLYRLVEKFDLESDLRRHLKATKIKVSYEILDVLDSNDFDDESDDEEENSGNGIILEIGKTDLKSDKFALSLLRVKLQ